jgi:hypothetical protein
MNRGRLRTRLERLEAPAAEGGKPSLSSAR